MKTKHHYSVGKCLDTTITYIILIIVSVIFLFPILWLVLASFSKTGSIYDFKGFFPSSFSLDSFKNLFTDEVDNYKKWLLNTLVIAFLASVLGTVLTTLTAYSLSRFRFKMRKSLMKFAMLLSMFPGFMTMTAVYYIMVNFKLVDNIFCLVLIYAAGAPMSYMVQKGYYDTISNSIYEAARIDGASQNKIFWRITMPLSKPILVYTALTAFAFPWSDFILPKLLLKNRDHWTVAVGLMSLDDTKFSKFAAGAVFIGVPIIVLYFCLSKFLVQGVSAGAVKE